jgi:hypothetical protein
MIRARLALAALFLLLTAPGARAATLKPAALQAWDRYVAWADAKVERELADRFLWQEYLAPHDKTEIAERLAAGQVAVRRVTGVVPPGTKFEVPDGSIHHWWGTILLPGVGLDEVLRFCKDYDHQAGRFQEVQQSRLLAKSGDTYRFFFRLRRTKAPITVYYNTEHECTYRSLGPKLASSRSVALRIAELENPGTAREREKPNTDDGGYLWRVVTWWRFKETPRGVIVEYEAASLGRNVPGFLRFIPGAIGYLESVPRESIENTLTSIRKHVARS